MPRKSKNLESNALDAEIENHVAARIRLRRNLLGMSQSELARSLGITFQQVQKYERGTNRVSVARLMRLAEILDVPLTFFFDDMEVAGIGKLRSESDLEHAASLDLSPRELQLLHAWRNAPTTVSDAVGALVRRVAGMEPDTAEEAPAPVPEPAPKPKRAAAPKAAAAKSATPKTATPKTATPKAAKPKLTAADTGDGKTRRRRGAVWDPADIK